MALSYWPEIKVRLRARQSPEAVHAELVRSKPGQPLPSAKTLRRLVKAQPESWFLPPEAANGLVQKDWTRVNVEAERTELYQDAKARWKLHGATEKTLNIPMAEAGKSLEVRVALTRYATPSTRPGRLVKTGTLWRAPILEAIFPLS